MTAREIISSSVPARRPEGLRSVNADMPAIDVLPQLLDSPARMLDVVETDGSFLGTIDQTSMLEGLGRLIAARDDCSVVTVECRPEDYSASLLAHAVEDADTHLVDLLTSPGSDDRVQATLRVRCSDPSAVVRSLERYDFNVTGAHGTADADMMLTAERLAALNVFLNV